MKKQLLVLATVLGSLAMMGQVTVVDTFSFTGAAQAFTVPACVDTINIKVYGAQGQNALIGGTGGLGGYATGDLLVAPGNILNIYVGGQNGYNGGGRPGLNGNNAFSMPPQGDSAGCGGGASDVRLNGTTLTDRVIVGGGGGGAGHNGVWPGCQVSGPGGNGGQGGGATGTDGVGNPCNCAGGGGAFGLTGTQSAGGVAGAYAGNTACLRSSWTIGQNGALGVGGAGATTYHNGSGGGGGGGGGYYGGGSAGNGSDTTPGGGGGGGSSFTGVLPNSSTTPGTRSGNGIVIIRYFNPCIVGVDEVLKKLALHVYPNPAGANVTVSMTGIILSSDVIIHDILGATVGVYKIAEGKSEITIDTQDLSKGVYFIELKTEYGSVIKKLVKN